MSNKPFTYPFCYTPDPQVVQASRELIALIDSSPALKELFSEGKMLGVLMVDVPQNCRPVTPSVHFIGADESRTGFLYGFSGLAGGKSIIEGFVPPIFDTTSVNLDASSPEESRRLQDWLFEQYEVCNARGETSTIKQIFAGTGLVPPGGTGDCAAPKMLQYAYAHGLKPVAMGEFWYGESPLKEVRRHGCFYPSCTGKCGPLLKYMLQGLEVEPNPLESDNLWSLEEPFIHYEDKDIIVVDKPAGMLAVPGKTGRSSLQDYLSGLCGCQVTACHRLDMDTSGLMVYAKNASSLASIQRQFEERSVQKKYLAILCAADNQGEKAVIQELPAGAKGTVKLPLLLDYYDRPRQMVDFDKGKMAVTQYEVLRNFPDGTAEVLFTPLTGRTHQIRVHAAHPLGLNRPICGDRLYGGCQPAVSSSRLMLHAATLVFRHPSTFGRMSFSSGFNRGEEKAKGEADKK